jgi:hypothetical protein
MFFLGHFRPADADAALRIKAFEPCWRYRRLVRSPPSLIV